MKIAIDARILSTSTGRYVERLLHYLQKIDQTNSYLVLLTPEDAGKWRATNPNFQSVAAPFKNYSLEEQTKFATMLQKYKPDLVHFCMPQQPLLYRGNKVTTIHDLTLLKTYNSDKNWFVFRFKQLIGHVVFFVIARTSKKLIAISDFTKKEFIEFTKISPEKIERIYEGSDMTTSLPAPYPDLQKKKYIMYVGQQSDYKNVRRLVQAHQTLLPQFPDLQLALVGKLSGVNGVPLQRNKQWVEQQGYKNVLFTDFVPDEQLAWLYQSSQAYVFPSLMEGFGLPGLEAMQCGAPVVSSNATCLPEVYGDAAHYFDPLSIDDIARAVREVLENPALRKELITKGHEQVNKYSWERMAQETLRVYEEALK